VLAAGCGSAAAPGPTAPGPAAPVVRGVATTEPVVSPVPYAAADLAFGLSVLTALCAQSPAANLVLSPSSLASGLGMAYLGARGATAKAMAAVLHLPAATAAGLLAGLQARDRALGRLDGPGVTVAGADQLWADPSLPPARRYTDAIATGYGAGLGQAPLLHDPAKAAAQIDAAIAATTKGHIPHLLTPGDLASTIFVLTDALYLNARWASPFLRSNDSTGRFAPAGGQRVSARYMFGTGYASAAADGWTAVRLPYRGGRLAMLALLPPAGPGESAGSAAGCPALTPATAAALQTGLKTPVGAAVEMPKVSLRSRLQLNAVLTGLGMGVAFGPEADLSGISPQAAAIGVVVHAATLRVDDAGTVGSAATGVTIVPTAGFGGPTVRFDRPYLMLIMDTQTGEPLFLARVADPDQS
jgi:serine protease inhibitor